MAKTSAVAKNEQRKKKSRNGEARRRALREEARQARKEGKDIAEIFAIYQQLNKLPRDTSRVRVRNRCRITGRPHGYFRRLEMSRIALRQIGSAGEIPGLVKSSW